MTDLLDRPLAKARRSVELPARSPLPPARRVVGEAVLGVVRSAGVLLAVLAAVVLVLWVLEPSSSGGAARALQVAGLAWLLAHGVPLHATATIDLVPLGITLPAAWLAYRTGRRLGRAPASADRLGALIGGGTFVAAYAATGVLVARLAATPGVTVSLPAAALSCAGFAAVFGGLGLLRTSPPGQALQARIPLAVRGAVAAGAAALGVLMLAGLATVVAGALARWGRVAEVAHAVAPTPAGTAGLVGLHLAVLPDAALWAVALAAGPGFGVGVGAWVSTAGIRAGVVPSLPILAALPAGPAAPPVLRLLYLAPLAAGVVAGLVARRRGRGSGPAVTAAIAAGAGLVAGVGVALLAQASSGSIGPGRMSAVGPVPAVVGAATLAEVALAAVAVTVLADPVRALAGRMGVRRRQHADSPEDEAAPGRRLPWLPRPRVRLPAGLRHARAGGRKARRDTGSAGSPGVGGDEELDEIVWTADHLPAADGADATDTQVIDLREPDAT